MYRRCAICLIWCLALTGLAGQGIRDSVFTLEPVMIVARPLFSEDAAGMKETLIDTAIMRAKVSQSLSDLLSENTSIFIKNHGRGALATASIRGTAASHTRVSWNGITINSPMAGMVDFSLIPVYLIDGISIRHGGASLKDGGGGIGGSVHIRNQPGKAGEQHMVYMQGIGSYRTFEEFLDVSLGRGSFTTRTRLYHQYSRNDFTFVNRQVGSVDPVSGEIRHPLDTNSNAAYMKKGLLQEFYFRPGDHHLLSLFYWGQSAERSIPRHTGFEGPDPSNLNRQSDLDHRLVARWDFEKDRDRVMVRSGYARKNLFYQQMHRVPGLGTIPAVWSESVAGSLFNMVRYEREMDHGFSLEAKAGLDLHRVHTTDTVTKSGYAGQRDEWSLYLAARKSFGTRLNLNLITTGTRIGGKFTPPVPFLGMDLRLLRDTDLVMKASVSRVYQHPTLNDLYWQPGGNPGLRPEQGTTVEAGLVYGTRIWGQELVSGLTAYHSEIRDWILWLPTFKGYWEPRNIREVLSTGFELDLSLNGRSGRFAYRFSGNYAFTRSINNGERQSAGDASPGKQLVYVPLHSGNALARISFGAWFLTYQFNAYGERYTTTSNDPSRRDRLYPYYMNDLAVGGRVALKAFVLEAELKAYNLFDESYHSVLYRPMPGRNYHLLLRIGI